MFHYISELFSSLLNINAFMREPSDVSENESTEKQRRHDFFGNENNHRRDIDRDCWVNVLSVLLLAQSCGSAH